MTMTMSESEKENVAAVMLRKRRELASYRDDRIRASVKKMAEREKNKSKSKRR